MTTHVPPEIIALDVADTIADAETLLKMWRLVQHRKSLLLEGAQPR